MTVSIAEKSYRVAPTTSGIESKNTLDFCNCRGAFETPRGNNALKTMKTVQRLISWKCGVRNPRRRITNRPVWEKRERHQASICLINPWHRSNLKDSHHVQRELELYYEADISCVFYTKTYESASTHEWCGLWNWFSKFHPITSPSNAVNLKNSEPCLIAHKLLQSLFFSVRVRSSILLCLRGLCAGFLISNTTLGRNFAVMIAYLGLYESQELKGLLWDSCVSQRLSTIQPEQAVSIRDS